MRVAQGYRDRDEVELAILQALVDRNEEGMTVFELRTHVAVDIDEIEAALGSLKEDDLIVVENGRGDTGTTTIKPADRVVPTGEAGGDESFLEWLRDRLPF
jgi:predicted transcriptional regulator